MHRLHLLPDAQSDGEDPDKHAAPDDTVARALRDLYHPPADRYWDSLEARVMAAVRAGRDSTTAVVHWWHALAAWARPGLAAAAIVIAVVSAAALQSRAARVAAIAADSGSMLEPMDAELARAFDSVNPGLVTRQEVSEARDIADLLIDGVYRRPRLALPREPRSQPRPVTDDEQAAVLRARRDATFRYVMP